MSTARTKVTTAGHVSGARECIWTLIRRLKEFEIDEITRATKASRRFTLGYLAGLESAGYLRRLSADHCRLVRDTGPEAPMLKSDGRELAGHCAREAMWRTSKILAGFTVPELVAGASTERCPVSAREAATYVGALVQAGYLAASRGGGRHTQYRFLPSRNTGPRPPVLRHVSQVYDPNEDKVVWQAGGAA